MSDAVVTVLFGAVLDEARIDVPAREAEKNALVASKTLESATKGESDAHNSRAAGRQALLPAPSMWN